MACWDYCGARPSIVSLFTGRDGAKENPGPAERSRPLCQWLVPRWERHARKEFVAKAAKAVVARGSRYEAAKLDPFGAGFYELDRKERLEIDFACGGSAGCGGSPDFDIFVEMHGRFSPAVAISIANDLEPFRPGWFEREKTGATGRNLAALKKVANAITHTPLIATGERIHSRTGMPQNYFELQGVRYFAGRSFAFWR